MAEHMLILKLISPEEKVYYIAAAFPSACGKTNLAMLEPTIPGWKVQTLGDDIAWMRFGKDGRLYAVNPEFGFFGVAPGTDYHTNPNAMRTIEQGNTVFTNVALTDDGDIWWEGMGQEPPAHLTSWKKQDWTPESDREGRAPELALLHADVAVPDPRAGVGRPGGRADLGDLLRWPPRHARFRWSPSRATGSTARSWVPPSPARRPPRPRARSAWCAATRWRCCPSSATTSVTTSSTGWTSASKPTPASCPRSSTSTGSVAAQDKRFLWPGFGENSRVLKWAIERIEGKAGAKETPIGYVPTVADLDTEGLTEDAADFAEALTFDAEEWRAELPLIQEWFDKIGDKVPSTLHDELAALRERLG